MDPWASTNQGLANLTSTLGTLAQFKRQDRLDAEQAQDHAKARTLADLQLKTEQQKFDDKAALRTELANVQGKYLYPEPQGVGPMQPEKAQTLSDLGPVQQPVTEESRMGVITNLANKGNTAAADQVKDREKAMMEKQKFAFDSFTAVSKAVKDGTMPEDEASLYYRHNMKLAGIDLDAAGVKMEFKKQGGYFSGKVTPDALFMVNGKPTPFGSEGIVTKARVVGQDPTTGKPIFEQDEDTTFKEEAKADTSHNIHKQLSADGKTAQDFQYNPKTQRYDIKLGNPYAVPSQVPNVNVSTGEGQGAVAQTTFVDSETGKPLVFDKKTGTYRTATVEGAGVAPKPGAMSPEQATRAQQFETITKEIPKIRDMVLDKDGNIISKLDIANSQVGTWGTKGREIKQAVKRTIEQALRIATGAAAPDSEVASYMGMYAPQVGDDKAMIAAKFKALEEFAEGTRNKFNIGRSPQAISQGNGGATPVKSTGKTSPKGKQIDSTTAQRFLRQAGGNKDKARELARKAGYSF
jgi:hypothetical protein